MRASAPSCPACSACRLSHWGLTVSLTDTRFEARRGLVAQEASALGTAWLRQAADRCGGMLLTLDLNEPRLGGIRVNPARMPWTNQ